MAGTVRDPVAFCRQYDRQQTKMQLDALSSSSLQFTPGSSPLAVKTALAGKLALQNFLSALIPVILPS